MSSRSKHAEMKSHSSWLNFNLKPSFLNLAEVIDLKMLTRGQINFLNIKRVASSSVALLGYRCRRIENTFCSKERFIHFCKALKLCSHYHDSRHDWNRGFNRGVIVVISSDLIRSWGQSLQSCWSQKYFGRFENFLGLTRTSNVIIASDRIKARQIASNRPCKSWLSESSLEKTNILSSNGMNCDPARSLMICKDLEILRNATQGY